MAKRRIKDTFENDPADQNPSFSMIADFEGNEQSLFDTTIEESIPILPLRNMVLFPTVVLPVSVGREKSLELVKYATRNNRNIAVFPQIDSAVEEPEMKDLYKVGTLAKIVKVFEMPDHTTTIVLQGMQRLTLASINQTSPFYIGHADIYQETVPVKSKEFGILAKSCKESAVKLIKLSENVSPDASFALKNINNNMFLVNFICANFPFSVENKMNMLSKETIEERAEELLKILDRDMEFARIRQSILRRTHEDLEKQQREYFLQQEIKNIQEELGGNTPDHDIEDLRKQASQKRWNDSVAQQFEKELAKLERTNSQSPDYNVQLSYLQTILGLPWNEYTTDNLDMKNAQKVLDRDHYGLEKVKERILEHLAVMKLRGDLKSPIICLAGPPGVGKTSLGQSIANALKRKYVRISLGGLHDESEIRGHRKTYIGAMPGRIIKGMARAGSSNPVFILDEIDKISQMTHQGDPASALLEVLDPEQNSTFHDNYLDIDYDLSKVMFIATANNLGSIPTPLLDRMEVIEVNGYITEEKIEIAKRHLIPKEMEENGLTKSLATFTPKAIEEIIENYTRESGVRSLEKNIAKICRKLACQYAAEGKIVTPSIKPNILKELLGARKYSRDKYQGNDYAGVVTGLAWTAVGGEILFIETSLSRGKEGRLTLTGNLGDVMKESAIIALEYIRSHAESLGLTTDIINSWNVHIHVPEGAVPKDGPSAGITMATSIASAFTQRKVRENLAMTGETTLRGKVLPVGGIREKILAAKRAGIKEIIMCSENRRDIEEIPEEYLKGLKFHYVDTVSQVWDIALLDEKVKNPLDITAVTTENKKP